MRETTQANNQLFHLPRLRMLGPQLPHISTLLIYTSQLMSTDLPLQSWLEMGLQGYALNFMLELNNQEAILLVQNPTHLAEIVTEGMRLEMEAFNQQQWYTTQTPLLLDQASSSNQQQWTYPMN